MVFPATPFHKTPSAVRGSHLYNCRGKRLAEGQLLFSSLPLGPCVGKISERFKKKKKKSVSKEFWHALNVVVCCLAFFSHFALSIQDLTLSH